MRLALFDFDGTITDRDSFFDFLIFTFGFPRFMLGLAAVSPVLLMFLARLIPNWKAKEAVFRHFLNGVGAEFFDAAAAKYSAERIPAIVRGAALERIEWHRERGHRIVVVSASAEPWIRGWCDGLGLDLIGTRLQVAGGRLTGRIDGKNCQGAEKVRRIRERYRPDDYEYIYAYGNSGGDRDMLSLADEQYYNWVRVV